MFTNNDMTNQVIIRQWFATNNELWFPSVNGSLKISPLPLVLPESSAVVTLFDFSPFRLLTSSSCYANLAKSEAEAFLSKASSSFLESLSTRSNITKESWLCLSLKSRSNFLDKSSTWFSNLCVFYQYIKKCIFRMYVQSKVLPYPIDEMSVAARLEPESVWKECSDLGKEPLLVVHAMYTIVYKARLLIWHIIIEFTRFKIRCIFSWSRLFDVHAQAESAAVLPLKSVIETSAPAFTKQWTIWRWPLAEQVINAVSPLLFR